MKVKKMEETDECMSALQFTLALLKEEQQEPSGVAGGWRKAGVGEGRERGRELEVNCFNWQRRKEARKEGSKLFVFFLVRDPDCFAKWLPAQQRSPSLPSCAEQLRTEITAIHHHQKNTNRLKHACSRRENRQPVIQPPPKRKEKNLVAC